MTDIIYSDKAKIKFRIAHKLMSGGNTFQTAHADMRTCPNLLFRKLYKKLMLGASHIKKYHQQHIVADFGAWLIHILYKDTAYNPITIWILKEIVNDKELVKYVNEHAVEPEDWYVNRWHETLEHTAKLQKEGKLDSTTLSADEMIFVPAAQQKIHKQMGEDEVVNIQASVLNEQVNKEIRKRKR